MIGCGEKGNTSSEKPVMNISSPYFLTTADHLGQNFVGESIFCDGNYSDWQCEMKNALLGKKKMSFIDGRQPMPKEDSADLMKWKRCNTMVRG